MKKKKIGFICTGNSARSQIAEGYAKYLALLKDRKDLEFYSAGASPTGYIHPLVIKVMLEEGIDLSDQYSKGLEDIPYRELDYLITLCGDAAERCPYLPGVKIEHWNISDPVIFRGSEEERLQIFRKIRDEIKKRVEALLETL
ncbi:MAG: arsenate reductase ArsC [Thermodesulfobacteriaceae bacterium]|nr:arsenate reductase ArsC [Thermodesulfobacteriaceae bacterium]MCX8041174.1 arsenate reductase ArsC [Thermodesulfobacteriaceae bacterium]MDW8135188.1 arsenate reductase ArsC [Thermodesulfobacterium sp.]